MTSFSLWILWILSIFFFLGQLWIVEGISAFFSVWLLVQLEAFVGRRYRKDLVDHPLQFVVFLLVHLWYVFVVDLRVFCGWTFSLVRCKSCFWDAVLGYICYSVAFQKRTQPNREHPYLTLSGIRSNVHCNIYAGLDFYKTVRFVFFFIYIFLTYTWYLN